MSKKKHSKTAVRRCIGWIMSVVGAGATAFFCYVWSSDLWQTVDEAGNATSRIGYLLLAFASFLLMVRGIDVLIHRENKERKGFNIHIPEI